LSNLACVSFYIREGLAAIRSRYIIENESDLA